MSYKLEEGHEIIAKGFSELINNRNNFQDAITLDVQDVRTTVLDIKKTVNAVCRLADETGEILRRGIDTHINQEGKIVQADALAQSCLDNLGKELNKELINLFANASIEEETNVETYTKLSNLVERLMHDFWFNNQTEWIRSAWDALEIPITINDIVDLLTRLRNLDSIEVGDTILLKPVEKTNGLVLSDSVMENMKRLTESVTNEVKEAISDSKENLRDKIHEYGWNDNSISEIYGAVNDIDNKFDDLENSVSNIEDSIENMGDLDFSNLDIVSDKVDDLNATLDNIDLEELNSDLNTMTKICTDNRADIARLHDSMNAQFNTLSEPYHNVNERLTEMGNAIDTQFSNISERLTQIGDATDIQFNNMKETWFRQELAIQKLIEDTINDKLMKPIAHINSKVTSDETGIVNFIQVNLPKYFETMKGSLEHLIDEKFIKYNQQLKDQTHNQIEDQEGFLVTIETKMETLDTHVKKLLGNIAFLEDFSEKSTDKELGDKIHYAITNGFTNLNSHVEDIVTEVKRIKEEAILTNYDAHTNNSQNESLEEN